MLDHRFQHGIEIGVAVAGDKGLRLRPGCRLAEKEDDLGRALRLQLDMGLQRTAGVEAGASPIRQRCRSGKRGGVIERTSASQELRLGVA
jgi:hypothetical protein